MRRGAGAAAFCAAPVRGSDQRRSGTQDVNDPVSGPATRPQGPSGSFTSWVPRVAVIEHISDDRARHSWRRAARMFAEGRLRFEYYSSPR